MRGECRGGGAVHEHDPGIECYCHNNPRGLPSKGRHPVRIEGVMQPNGMLRYLMSDPNRS